MMSLFEYEDFQQVYTNALNNGSTRDDAIRHAYKECLAFLYIKNNLTLDSETHERLLTDALASYKKKKLSVWKSHDVTTRVTVFNIRYAVSRMYRLKQVQEQEQQYSSWRYEAYSRTEPSRNDQTRGVPPRPAGTGKYSFPEPEYANTSRAPPKPAGTGRYTFSEPKYPGQSSSRPSSNAQEYTTKEFRPSADARFTPHTPFFFSNSTPPPPRSTYTARPTEQSSGSYSGFWGKFSYSTSYSTSSNDSRPPPHSSKHSSQHTNPPRPSRPSQSSQRPKTPPPPPLPQSSSGELDFYQVLNVSRTATAAEIKSAYRKLSLKHHPDRVAPAEKVSATEKMAGINRAYDVLGDEVERRRYDCRGF
jgi:hypothetical protein